MEKIKFGALLLLLLASCIPASGQFQTQPTLTEKEWVTIGIASTLTLTGSMVANSNFDFNSYSLQEDYLEHFKHSYDDYLQYLPGAVLVGMKAAGLEGATSWSRMLVSDAFAIGLNALMINGLKYSIGRERPDRSAQNSFPSGHTATAFMTATMLNKEYGNTLSPWIGFGGYLIATTTGFSRITNNRHWFSDILAGAGIGILSTELGYLIGDLIFQDEGLYLPEDNGYEAPQYKGYIGIGLGPVHLPTSSIPDAWGNHYQLDLLYYFSPHWGVYTQLNTIYSAQNLRFGLAPGIAYGYPIGERLHLETTLGLCLEKLFEESNTQQVWELGIYCSAALQYKIHTHLAAQLYGFVQHLPQAKDATASGVGIKCCYLW